jgi:hypothetical protein
MPHRVAVRVYAELNELPPAVPELGVTVARHSAEVP